MQNKKTVAKAIVFFMACPTGIEPAVARVGVWCIIQLCYGQI